MPYAAAPAKAEISGTPTNTAANAGFGKLWDMLTGLFGSTGKPGDAYAAMKLLDPRTLLNLAPSFSVAANALTITLKDKGAVSLSEDNPGFVAQRHATIANGDFNLRKIAADISLVVSSGSTLGHITARLCPIYIYLIDNAGAQELAVAGTFQGESGIFTTVAEGGAGAADNPDVMYSANARTNVSGRLAAIAWSNQAAAGTWTAVPTEVKQQPFHLELVGQEVTYMGGTVPYGFFLEDGSNVSRTTYGKLFAKTNTAWGVGDGSTTFGLPDSRRRASVGSGGTGTGTLGNAVGNVGGAETHTLSTTESVAHDHLQGEGNAAYAGRHGQGSGAVTQGFATAAFIGTTASGNLTSTVGGGGAHNNMQPSMVATKMIRWLGDI